jgi:AraC-like DNA-binding protein
MSRSVTMPDVLEPGIRMRGSTPRWLTRATDLVHARFRDNLRIDDIAAEAGVHAAHLAVVFRRVHRQPLGSYMRRLRVGWAADRLLDTDATVAAIACEAGFADQAHLTRCFRQMLGTTPAAYRRARLFAPLAIADDMAPNGCACRPLSMSAGATALHRSRRARL